jgi:hypothetical protein
VEICRLLIQSGAKLDAANREGLTPLQLAKPEITRIVQQIHV